LLEDLQTLGYSGLLEKPWGFKDEEVVRELLDGVSNEFDNTIRGTPTRWTEAGLSRGRFRTDGRSDDGRGGVRDLDAPRGSECVRADGQRLGHGCQGTI
jgi:hypothetical protein